MPALLGLHDMRPCSVCRHAPLLSQHCRLPRPVRSACRNIVCDTRHLHIKLLAACEHLRPRLSWAAGVASVYTVRLSSAGSRRTLTAYTRQN